MKQLFIILFVTCTVYAKAEQPYAFENNIHYDPDAINIKDAPCILLITGDRDWELPGRYKEKTYRARKMKLTSQKPTRLYELPGFDHAGMHEPAFLLLIKEVTTASK